MNSVVRMLAAALCLAALSACVTSSRDACAPAWKSAPLQEGYVERVFSDASKFKYLEMLRTYNPVKYREYQGMYDAQCYARYREGYESTNVDDAEIYCMRGGCPWLRIRGKSQEVANVIYLPPSETVSAAPVTPRASVSGREIVVSQLEPATPKPLPRNARTAQSRADDPPSRENSNVSHGSGIAQDIAAQAANRINAAGYYAARENLVKCLSVYSNGSKYSSFDGGVSAMNLLWIACGEQGGKWVKHCVEGGEKEEDCNFQAAILAQAALKLRGN